MTYKRLGLWAGILAAGLLTACASTSEQQHLEFSGFTVERGLYKAKDGYGFFPNDDGTVRVALKDNSDSGGKIEPCACALTTGGTCDQATFEEGGVITEIWCVSDGCGFCVGGTTVDDELANNAGKLIDPGEPPKDGVVQFRVPCRDENGRLSRFSF